MFCFGEVSIWGRVKHCGLVFVFVTREFMGRGVWCSIGVQNLHLKSLVHDLDFLIQVT